MGREFPINASISIDRKANMLYIKFKAIGKIRTEKVNEYLNVDYTKSGKMVGVEIFLPFKLRDVSTDVKEITLKGD